MGASLSSRTTTGERAWDKYFSGNIEKIRQTQFTLRHGKTRIYDPCSHEPVNEKTHGELTIEEDTLVDVRGKPAVKTSLGLIHLSRIEKPVISDVMRSEDQAFQILQRQIHSLAPVTISIGEWSLPGIEDVVQPHGTPKADFCLVDSHGTYKGFISHKKPGGAKAFQQYGGISAQAGIEHPEIDSFIETVYNDCHSLYPGYAVYRPVQDPWLSGAAVYGFDYERGFGLDNVHCIGQGEPHIDETGVLSFSDGMHVNPEIMFTMLNTSFRSVLFAIRKTGRRIAHTDGWELRDVRGGIGPQELMRCRQKAREI